MSKTIYNPTLAQIDEHNNQSATFTISPLHTGYGMTLGNSLRRVLLSSIAGAAVTAFKIEGTTHEFTTVKGVKEDVVDIMLNLKQVRFRVFNDEPQVVRLTKKGSGAVTATDITTNADVEVVTPEAIICTIDDAKTEIVMDIVIETGRGYRTVEESSTQRIASDMIAVDALFSPVERVRYKVESTRVGQTTNLDQLIITVDTDNSISPRDAFEEAAAILINQYSALAGQTRVDAGQPLASQHDGEDDNVKLMTPIEDLDLSARTTNALLNNEIRTIKDLVTLGDEEMRELKGFGSKALDEVKEKLVEMEL